MAGPDVRSILQLVLMSVALCAVGGDLCPSGWLHFTDPYHVESQGSCYFLSADVQPYDAAEAACR